MKLLIPGLLLAAAIAAVVWVLAPPSTPTAPPRGAGAPTAARATPATGTAEADRDPTPPADPARGAEAERKAKGAEALAAARARVAAAQADPSQAGAPTGAASTGGLGAVAAAGLEPDEQPPKQVGPSKWGRQGRPPAQIALKSVQDSVRAYYGNLPKLGEVPATVRLEELFPVAVIDEMNLPPGGRVVELGPFPIADRQAFTHLLGPEDSAPGAVGVTVITPDGERVREYLFFPQPGE